MRTSTTPILITLSFLFVLAAADVNVRAQQVKIVHIDVGQGDATLIVGPERTLLFDAGVRGSGARIRAVLTSLGLDSIDFFVAGHYHGDHIGAIDELIDAGISINVASFDRSGSGDSPQFPPYVAAVGARRRTITLGARIDLGGGCVLTCVAVDGRTNRRSVTPSDENGRSVALVLRFGTFDYLIASDLTGGGLTGGTPTADVESPVAADVGDIDVLHVNHHGSNTSTNQAYVNTLRPEHAVISCGDGNTHRHPRQPVLDRLTAASQLGTIWQTEAGNGGTSPKVVVGGDIIFLTDGTSITVTTSAPSRTFTFPTDGVAGGGSAPPPVPAAGSVVINEVAWMGSRTSAADEWVELHNTTNAPVDLTGWRIVADAGAQEYVLSGTVPAGGFFLVERRRGATRSRGDLTLSNLSLTNAGDALELKDAGGMRHDVVNSSGAGWFAGAAAGGRFTMERIDPTAGGDDPGNWANNDGATRNGSDSGGRRINGTPGAKNSASP